MLNEFTKLGNEAYESLKELANINAKAAEKLAAEQMDILDSTLETSTRQLFVASDAKDIQEALNTQANLVTEYNEKVLTFAQNATTILTESKDEITAWIEKGVESVSAANSPAPVKAKKAPARKAPAKKAPAKKAPAKRAVAKKPEAA